MAKNVDSQVITDAVHSDPDVLEKNAGLSGKYLIRALDKAVHMQTGAIEGYISWLRKKNPEKSPQELQVLVDKHFMRLASGSGAGVGMAAAVPGIGFVTGALAVGGESLVFLDAAAFYTMASAHLRGIDIRQPERRRGLILVVLLGTAGNAIVDAAVGDLAQQKKAPALALSRFNLGSLMEVNGRMMKYAIKQVNRRFRAAWIGKIMPFGIGAVVGTVTNRKIAKQTIGNAYDSLGPIPASF